MMLATPCHSDNYITSAAAAASDARVNICTFCRLQCSLILAKSLARFRVTVIHSRDVWIKLAAVANL